MKISLEELRNITDILFTHLESQGQITFDIKEDYYWHISQDERYIVEVNPKELTIGQLSDDWLELQSYLHPDRDPLGYGLVWLASILLHIGENTVG